MSQAFRTLLQKIGSGPHTGTSLTRAEAAEATYLMLTQTATPAQIGAFLIAHRIRRPTGEELAGMLDTYAQLGPQLQSIGRTVTVFGHPYDGRSRTAPVATLVALILAVADCPVILHGGDRMPTKQGLPLVTVWQQLGVDWTGLTLSQVQTVLERTGIGFVHLRSHFPLAYGLVQYREEIGKRPPLATLELMWAPYEGDCHVIAGYVHPPTEGMIRTALNLRGQRQFTTVKGLEGSCDLPRERPCILGLAEERLVLHPHDYSVSGEYFGDQAMDPQTLNVQPLGDQNFSGKNVELEETHLPAQLQSILRGEASELMRSTLWNAGFYLWRCGACKSVEQGVILAKQLLQQGLVSQKLNQLQTAVRSATEPALSV